MRSPNSRRDSNRISRRIFNLRYFLLAAFAAVLLLTISCRRNNSEFVTVALPEKFTTLDTLTSTASDSAADRVRNLIFNTLVRKNESFDYVGELAQDISVSPDGMTVTFKLHDNVKFHNGKPFTSADVKYTFDELFKSNSFKSKAFFDTEPIESANPASDSDKSSNSAGDAKKLGAGEKAPEPKTKSVPHIVS